VEINELGPSGRVRVPGHDPTPQLPLADTLVSLGRHPEPARPNRRCTRRTRLGAVPARSDSRTAPTGNVRIAAGRDQGGPGKPHHFLSVTKGRPLGGSVSTARQTRTATIILRGRQPSRIFGTARQRGSGVPGAGWPGALAQRLDDRRQPTPIALKQFENQIAVCRRCGRPGWPRARRRIFGAMVESHLMAGRPGTLGAGARPAGLWASRSPDGLALGLGRQAWLRSKIPGRRGCAQRRGRPPYALENKGHKYGQLKPIPANWCLGATSAFRAASCSQNSAGKTHPVPKPDGSGPGRLQIIPDSKDAGKAPCSKSFHAKSAADPVARGVLGK